LKKARTAIRLLVSYVLTGSFGLRNCAVFRDRALIVNKDAASIFMERKDPLLLHGPVKTASCIKALTAILSSSTIFYFVLIGKRYAAPCFSERCVQQFLRI
jgi:hypothetical protein